MSGKFRKYDYGSKTNLKLYGGTDPPKYNLENVRVPTKLYVAQSDEFSSVLKKCRLSFGSAKLTGLSYCGQKRLETYGFRLFI